MSDHLRSLLTVECQCEEDWTARGRHAPDCFYQFVHDYLDDDEIAAILAASQPPSGDALREWVAEASNAIDREGSTDWDNTAAVADAVATRLWNLLSMGLLQSPALATPAPLDADG